MTEGLNFYNVLILYNDDFYKEIDLDGFEKDEVVIGNTDDSDIKLKIREYKDISIVFERKNNSWIISSQKSVYCTVNGIKVSRRILINGDKIGIKSSETKKELFKINYFIDFVVENENYDRIVSLENIKTLKIGQDNNNHIVIEDEMIEKLHAEIVKDKEQFYLVDFKTKFGIYLNGKKVENKTILKDNDFIIMCGYKFLYKSKTLSMSKVDEKIRINGLEELDNPLSKSILQYPCFYRSPRILKDIPKDDIVIEAPPEKEKKSGENILLTLIPLIGTAVITLIMSGVGNGSNAMLSVAMVGLTGSVAVFTYVSQVIKKNNKNIKRYKIYKEYIKSKEEIIKEKREIFANSIKEMNPDTENCIDIVEEFNRRMWERSKEHQDFLNISIGSGESPLSFDIKIPDEVISLDKDKLREDPKKLKEAYDTYKDLPIMVDLVKEAPVGIYGNRPYTLELIKNILMKISTLHYYEEVKILVVYPESEDEEWKWIKWLPHVWSDKRNIRYMANTKESAHNVLNVLYDEIKQRKNAASENRDEATYSPHYIVVIADNTLVENEPIMPILEEGENLGVTGIFLYDYIGLIPKDCKKLIEVVDNNNIKLITTDGSMRELSCTFNKVEEKESLKFSRTMSPVFVKSSFTQGSLSSYITLFDMYKISNVDELKIINKWNSNKVYETMAVPLGVKVGDELVYLNLHEKSHGPHGLVAGTTGSGKSEILQTYIASLAINYHPYDVAIIIIDYKGGGMANQFKDLPHLVGTITNLDGNQINRSLVSIKSELKRRQRIFGEYNVNHIDSYIKLFKQGKASEPIPHLIIIADEFAELKSDQPEFMAELVSTARIGRSLGVHLILATQKPAGVVDDQIWSNSKFKLCLKVQNAEDSNEVIKSPLAANIVEPGRAYFQVGNNEIFELFQSAWSGAKKYDDDDVSQRDIDISQVLIDGSRKLIYSSKDDEKKRDGKPQLDIVIEAINEEARRNGIERIQGPWLPALKEIIFIKEIIGEFSEDKWREKSNQIAPLIGLIDNPQKQMQAPAAVNASEDGHMLIVGSPGVGKTTLLQTLITSIISSYTPEEINLYIIDLGTRVLKIFEQAPQVGGVLTSDDDELMKNLIKYIHKEIKRRKVMFSEIGVSNYLAYEEATGEKLPHIMLVIDNYAAFTELFEAYDDDMTIFSREGINLGITLVVTASNSSTVRYKMSSNFKINIALNCVDKGEYSNILGRVSIEPSANQGRGLIKLDDICEFQVALPAEGDTEVERGNNIKSLIKKINSLWDKKGAVRIPRVPEKLPLHDFIEENVSGDLDSNIPIGLDVGEFEIVGLDFNYVSTIPIIGRSKSGKSSCMSSICQIINNKYKDDNVATYVFDSTSFGLVELEELPIVSRYCNDRTEIISTLYDIKEEVDRRKEFLEEMMQSSKGKIKESDVIKKFSKMFVVIDNANEFLEYLADEYDLMDVISDILNKDNGYGITFIMAGEEEEFTNLSYSHNFIDNIKKNNIGILLDELEDHNFFKLKIKYGVEEKAVRPGDGYLVTKENHLRIKIPV
ncbi:type VII secretion protein EssC [Clostridium intestinale]|uniref:Type VII secretion protein EssC n=1 Tax=Clostridium intestinale TaxID=36845 RepID=A0A7D6VRQ5_9CLOT|nr:type VII secretion protein EssC [Clostridium intestinale]QLY81487.1 type VII secretion protein EssC [Clostridium intestinale]